MTTNIAKSLRFLQKINGCEYYYVDGPCQPPTFLKIYQNPLHRLLTSYTMKGLVGSTAETEIVESNQGKILRSYGIEPSYEHPYYGRSLIVEETKAIPIDFIVNGEEIDFVVSQEVISREEALRRIPQDDSSAFLEEIVAKAKAIHLKAQERFHEKKMSIESLKLNFGIRSANGEPAVPLWVGEGITPRTAIIFAGEEQISDCTDFAVRIVHPRVLEREMRGNR